MRRIFFVHSDGLTLISFIDIVSFCPGCLTIAGSDILFFVCLNGFKVLCLESVFSAHSGNLKPVFTINLVFVRQSNHLNLECTQRAICPLSMSALGFCRLHNVCPAKRPIFCSCGEWNIYSPRLWSSDRC